MDQARRQKVFQELLEQACLTEDDVKSRLEKALAPAYWQELNPDLSIGANTPAESIETAAVDPRKQSELLDKFAREGYFQAEPMVSDSVIRSMRRCIEVLRREDWPPVFAFVYDQFWLATSVPSLVRLLSALLGPGYRQIPHIWAYYVRPVRGATGWGPHTDGKRKSKKLSVWIPLSDATLDNGCMYVIPKDLIDHRIVDDFASNETVSTTDLLALLQSSRALPACAGSVLCWHYGVIHWGSTCSHDPGEPRISMAVEFIGENIEPSNDEIPLLDTHSRPPPFAHRLHAIAKGIMSYRGWEPRLIRYLELAKQLARVSTKSFPAGGNPGALTV